MNNLLTAIYGKCTGSLLSADVGGRIFFAGAPEGTEFPYVVFFNVAGNVERTFTERYSEYQFQFDLFSKSESVVEIAKMHTDLIALFDECSMTITSSTLEYMRQLGEPLQSMDEVTTTDGTSRIHHWSQDFEIRVSLN